MNARIYRLIDPNVAYAGVFAHGMGQSMVLAMLPALGREVGLREVMIGSIISMSSLVFFIASRAWGRLSDRLGRKPVILIGLWGYSAGTLLFALLFGLGMWGMLGGMLLYILIMLARMAQSVVMSGTAPATSAHVADTTTPAMRASGMGRLAAASNIGSIVGPAIAGTLAAASLLLPLVFAAVTTALTALLIRARLPGSGSRVATHQPAAKLHLRDRRYRGLLFLGMAVFSAFAIVQQTLAFLIQDTLVLDTRATARNYGYAMMVFAAASLLAQTVIVQRLKPPPLLLLRWGLPLLLLGFIVLAGTVTATTIGLTMILMGLALGLCGPGFNAAISLAVAAHEQGAAAGIATAIPSLGFILGPVAGTWMYQLDPRYPYLFTTLMLLPACIGAFRVRQHVHKDP